MAMIGVSVFVLTVMVAVSAFKGLLAWSGLYVGLLLGLVWVAGLLSRSSEKFLLGRQKAAIASKKITKITAKGASDVRREESSHISMTQIEIAAIAAKYVLT